MLDPAFELVSDSAFDSVIGKVTGEIVGSAMHLAVVSSVSLKLTSRLVRTVLLTEFYSLNMVVASYSNSYSFSDRGTNLPLILVCDLSAYAVYSKVLICL